MSFWPAKNSRIQVDVVIKREEGQVDPGQIAELIRLGEILRTKTAELKAALSSAEKE